MTPLRWALLGVGTAGRARARAILADPRCELAAVHRGRYAADLGVPIEPDLDRAIASAQAVAVCSPSEHHAEQVERALQAGRHVVVEFPLALDATRAAALLDLARRRGRVLHEEHIELLTGAAAALRAAIPPETVREVEIAFTARGEPLPGAELAFRNVARLHRLVDFAGPIGAIDSVTQAPGRLQAVLRGEQGAEIRLDLRQDPSLARHTRITLEARSGRWFQLDRQLWRDGELVHAPDPEALFAADHALAMGRILEDRPPTVPDDRIVHVLAVAERLRDRALGTLR